WTYNYDIQGRRIKQTDPDAGTSSTSYDQLGRVATTTDGRGQQLSYTYDALGRLTGEFSGTDTTKSANQLAAWTYDSLAKGFPTSSTRYTGGASGNACSTTITGYNTAYQPAGTTISIPTTAEGKLGGTYTVSADYTPTVGLLAHSSYNADGSLSAESVGYGY